MPLFGLASLGIAAMFFASVLFAYGRRGGVAVVLAIWVGTVAATIL